MQNLQSKPRTETVSDELSSFVNEISEHVSALQDAAHARLQSMSSRDGSASQGIQIKISVHPSGGQPTDGTGHNAPSVEFLSGAECWTATYICGKGSNGYITCTREVCMIVG